jgi:bacterioferritin-associated ferredoxin
MFVCVCRAVTEEEVVKVIDEGADSLAQVEAACGAGGDCGACRGMIGEMIEQRRACRARRRLPLVGEEAA